MYWDSVCFVGRRNTPCTGVSCFASLPEHVNKCLENAKGATQSCEGDACLFSLKDDILGLDASIGGHLLSHNISVIEELKDEVFSALVRRSQFLIQDLTRLSLEDRPNLVDFFEKWTQLKEFLSKEQHGLSQGQHGGMNAQFEQVLERMKAVHQEAEAKMNLTVSIDRMLVLAKSLEDGETSNSDLQHVSLMLSQAVENRKDHAALSMEYQKWIDSLCSGLQDFVGKLDSFGPEVTFMFVAITDHLEAYLQECHIKTALAAGKIKVEESLQTMKGLQEVRKTLDKQRTLWKWLLGRKNALVRSVETYLTVGLDKAQHAASDPRVDLVMTFEQFEPLRTGMDEKEIEMGDIEIYDSSDSSGLFSFSCVWTFGGSERWLVIVWLPSSTTRRCPCRMAAKELAHHVQPLQERARDSVGKWLVYEVVSTPFLSVWGWGFRV